MSLITTIHTDGACAQNTDKVGGWALVLNHGESVLSGYEFDTTNNRMELVAIRAAVTLAKTDRAVDIRSDSEWAVNSLNGKNSVKSNVDLVVEIQGLIEQHGRVTLTWIRRDTEPSHIRADQMAKRQVEIGRKAQADVAVQNPPEGVDTDAEEE